MRMRCRALIRLLVTFVALIGVMPATGAVIVGDATDAGGGDAGADAGLATTEVAASDDTIEAEPGEGTGTSATTAVRSMRPRFALSSVERKREPSHRKM